MRIFTDKKGLSPVVATVILCGVVLSVGISAWSLTYSITSGLESNYYEEVKEMMDAIKKRFTVENIAYNGTVNKLYVWIYNYGEVDIKVIQVLVRGDVQGTNSTTITITSGHMVRIDVPLTATPGNEIAITVEEGLRRQNFVYATYVVPSS